MIRNGQSGSSLLEVIAAVVILAVVATATVATVAPIRAHHDAGEAEREVALLNEISQSYFSEHGGYAANVHQLAGAGYLPNSTPADQAKLARLRRSYRYAQTTGRFATRP